MVTEGVLTPAHVLAEAIRRREVSSAEIVDTYLAQIARYNPQLNAVVTLDEDGARRRAREADAALERGWRLMALDRRDEVMRAWDEFFSEWDALIMLAGTNTAERHGEEPTEPSQEYPYSLSQVSGCPMVVIPAGVDSQGSPFGLQILGKRWNDERLLDIVESLSELTGGFRRPPGY